MASIGIGLLWGAAAKANAGEYQGHMRHYHHNNKSMRPPGALPESEFFAACTRCASV